MNEAYQASKRGWEHPASQVRRSVQRMLAQQHPSGGFVASPDFAQYQFSWLRDGSFVAYALDQAGETEAAGRFHAWCTHALDRAAPLITQAIEALEAGRPVAARAMPPARFSMDGAVVNDDWPNFQVDGYGTWLWAFAHHLRSMGPSSVPAGSVSAVATAARYLATFGTSPCFDVWEEDGGSVHTVTLGAVYAGLRSAADLLGDTALAERAEQVRATVLDQARRDGYFSKSDHHSTDVDGALAWLGVAFGLVAPTEPALTETVRRISTGLDLDGGIRRYAADTYYGGGAWPVLTASLGWHYAALGDVSSAERCLSWVETHIDADGRLAEQYGGDQRDPRSFAEWFERWGPPAQDLVWSHAMYVILAVELASAGLLGGGTTGAGHGPAAVVP